MGVCFGWGWGRVDEGWGRGTSLLLGGNRHAGATSVATTYVCGERRQMFGARQRRHCRLDRETTWERGSLPQPRTSASCIPFLSPRCRCWRPEPGGQPPANLITWCAGEKWRENARWRKGKITSSWHVRHLEVRRAAKRAAPAWWGKTGVDVAESAVASHA